MLTEVTKRVRAGASRDGDSEMMEESEVHAAVVYLDSEVTRTQLKHGTKWTADGWMTPMR